MKFGKQLEERAHPPWRYSYIDYGGLKQTLGKVKEAIDEKKEEEEVNAMKRKFQAELDDQLLKILGFFHVKERELRWRMRQLKAAQSGTIESSSWVELARDTVLLLQFLHLNYQGMRKIHKKYCKITEPIRPREAQERGGLVLHFRRPPGDSQREHEHVSFLPPDLASDLRDMQEHSTLRQLVRELRQNLSQLRKLQATSPSPHVSFDIEQGRSDLAQLQWSDSFVASHPSDVAVHSDHGAVLTASSASKASLDTYATDAVQEPHHRAASQRRNSYTHAQKESMPFERNIAGLLDSTEEQREHRDSGTKVGGKLDGADSLSSTSWAYLPGGEAGVSQKSQQGTAETRLSSRSTYNERLALIDALLAKLEEAEHAADEGASLVTTATFVSAQAGIFAEATPGLKVTQAVVVGLLLNLIAVFIFMANYTLVIPSTNDFAQYLGLPATFAGVCVGAADVTMIASALMHSVWTNHAFKSPLAFGAFCCAAGNMLYSAAYDMHSKYMLIAGRLLIGFGGTRAVSRRFIADFIGSTSRTTASVSFVVASTVGMAFGPTMAYPLGDLKSRSLCLLPSCGSSMTVNYLTLPGYTMAIAWLVFLLVCVLAMREPKKVVSAPLEKPLLRVGSSSRENLNDFEEMHEGATEASNETKQLKHDSEKRSNGDRGNPAQQQKQGMHKEDSHDENDEDDDEDDDDDDDAQHSYLTAWRGNAGQGPAAATCLFAIYALKAVQEAACTATPLVMQRMFSWGSARAGLLLGSMLVGTLPINFAAGALAKHVGERTLMLASNGCLLLSSVALMHPPKDTMNKSSESLAGTIAALSGNLMGTTVLEGVAYSILSKRMPAAMTKGVLNAGFLATCGGTLGRLTGNVFVAGFHVGEENPLRGILVYGNMLFGSCAVLSLATTSASLATWRRLLSP